VRSSQRGFTLVELIITVAIVVILASLAYLSLARSRPRANLLGTTAELEALLRNARQDAMTSGRDVAVLVFPDASNSRGGVGRVVAVQNAPATFFSMTVAGDDLVQLEFPRGIAIGLGGLAAPALPAPYGSITAAACSYCKTTGNHRGAIRFDPRGSATFYSDTATPLDVPGGTIALQGTPEVPGHRLLVITAAAGSVFPLNNG
jgi:prepilin-type N-terminal cleavage/methylation domain-containing protein